MVKLSPALYYRCSIYSTGLRSSKFVSRIVGGMKSSTFASGKRLCRCAGEAVLSKDKNPPGISRICMTVASGQEDCRDSSLCTIHFDTRVDKWISMLPSSDWRYLQI